jgi:hypothetical protein
MRVATNLAVVAHWGYLPALSVVQRPTPCPDLPEDEQ